MMNEESVAKLLKEQNDTAIACVQAGEYEAARKYFMNCISIEDQLQLGVHRARRRVNLANVLCLLEQYQNALEVLEEAKELFSREKSESELLDCRILECRVLLMQKEWKQAEKKLNALLRDCRKEKLRTQNELLLAQIYEELEDPRALILLNRAVLRLEGAAESSTELAYALRQRISYYQKRGLLNLAAIDQSRLKELEEAAAL